MKLCTVTNQIDRFFGGVNQWEDPKFITATALELSDRVIAGEELTWTSPEETRVISDDTVLEQLSNDVEFCKQAMKKALDGKAEPFARMKYNITLLELIKSALEDYQAMPDVVSL